MSAPTENSTAVHSLYAAGYGCKQGEAARPALAALKSKAKRESETASFQNDFVAPCVLRSLVD